MPIVKINVKFEVGDKVAFVTDPLHTMHVVTAYHVESPTNVKYELSFGNNEPVLVSPVEIEEWLGYDDEDDKTDPVEGGEDE